VSIALISRVDKSIGSPRVLEGRAWQAGIAGGRVEGVEGAKAKREESC
jgi:hypothetical protein